MLLTYHLNITYANEKYHAKPKRGYGDILLARYPSLRKYFPAFLHLPFQAKPGTELLLKAIQVIRQLDAGELKKLPQDVPTDFIPRELRRSLKGKEGKIQRNAWELETIKNLGALC
ncbi:hypothetical protein [Xenorhabdus vietnamensis]|uniref:hypothetical protein n=1 Tax=Xenorhabdus vietnamensis TaxID=351656 RepID=UPI001ABF7A9D|nr:hypothetical protein [Xenorhabdus vietnamensis]